MFNFFKRTNAITDISWLGADIHSHILSGIDDGATELTQSLRYVKGLHELGYSRLIGTPHILKELYPNDRSTIEAKFKDLTREITNAQIPVRMDYAAEYMIDEGFDLNSDLCLIDEKYILIEMSYLNESPDIDKVIFELQVKGFQPILAHPERYIYYFKDPSRLKKFKLMGCMMQLNLLSVLNYYGKDVKKMSEYLLGEKIYDFAGTDLHHDRHFSLLNKSITEGSLYKLLGHYPFKNREAFVF